MSKFGLRLDLNSLWATLDLQLSGESGMFRVHMLDLLGKARNATAAGQAGIVAPKLQFFTRNAGTAREVRRAVCARIGGPTVASGRAQSWLIAPKKKFPAITHAFVKLYNFRTQAGSIPPK
jgi:hypothetical protein